MSDTAIPILAVVGLSNSGKTTLIEKLIPILTAKGYKVATVKHDVHRIDLDTEGKDSWRHREAGAAAVVLVSGEMVFLTESIKRQPSLEEVRSRYLKGNFDLILAEGFKQERVLKIEISREARSSAMVTPLDDPFLLAVVTDRNVSAPCPIFGLDEVAKVSALIEERMIKQAPRSG